jgi:hypothetical protein
MVVYGRYRCERSSISFTTLDQEFLNGLPPYAIDRMSFITTWKTGISFLLFELIKAGMMAPGGVSRELKIATANLASRHAFLVQRFAANAQEHGEPNGGAVMNQLQFMKENALPDAKSWSDFWLKQTEHMQSVTNRLMDMARVRRVVQIDGTYKFSKHLFEVGPDKKRFTPENCKCLLLVLNEIGQICYYALCPAENREELKKAMKIVSENNFERPTHDDDPVEEEEEGEEEEDQVDDDGVGLRHGSVGDAVAAGGVGDGGPFIDVVTDNPNSQRAAIMASCGEGVVEVKQDPIHMQWRHSEKLQQRLRKEFMDKYSAALWDNNGQLFPPNEMLPKVAALLSSYTEDQMSVPKSEWDATTVNSLEHIRSGELYPIGGNNFWVENGRTRKVVSTSAVEGVNRLVNKLINRDVSVVVGMRMLAFFVAQVNIDQGIAHGRIPDLHGMDILTLLNMTIRAQGHCVLTKPMEFGQEVLRGVASNERALVKPTKRADRVKHWCNVLNVSPTTTTISADTSRPKANGQQLITVLLAEHRKPHARRVPVTAVQLLRLKHTLDFPSAEFNGDERAVVTSVTQFTREQPWGEDSIAITLLYNKLVSADSSKHSLRLKTPGEMHRFVSNKKLLSRTKPDPGERSQADALPLFKLLTPRKPSSEMLENAESAFEILLFTALQEEPDHKRKKRFVLLWNFASALSEEICVRPAEMLQRRWNVLRRKKLLVEKASAKSVGAGGVGRMVLDLSAGGVGDDGGVVLDGSASTPGVGGVGGVVLDGSASTPGAGGMGRVVLDGSASTPGAGGVGRVVLDGSASTPGAGGVGRVVLDGSASTPGAGGVGGVVLDVSAACAGAGASVPDVVVGHPAGGVGSTRRVRKGMPIGALDGDTGVKIFEKNALIPAGANGRWREIHKFAVSLDPRFEHVQCNALRSAVVRAVERTRKNKVVQGARERVVQAARERVQQAERANELLAERERMRQANQNQVQVLAGPRVGQKRPGGTQGRTQACTNCSKAHRACPNKQRNCLKRAPGQPGLSSFLNGRSDA